MVVTLKFHLKPNSVAKGWSARTYQILRCTADTESAKPVSTNNVEH